MWGCTTSLIFWILCKRNFIRSQASSEFSLLQSLKGGTWDWCGNTWDIAFWVFTGETSPGQYLDLNNCGTTNFPGKLSIGPNSKFRPKTTRCRKWGGAIDRNARECCSRAFWQHVLHAKVAPVRSYPTVLCGIMLMHESVGASSWQLFGVPTSRTVDVRFVSDVS